MGHLTAHLKALAHVDSEDDGAPISDAAAVSLFYIGAALAVRDPNDGRALLAQLEREMAETTDKSPEAVEVHLRATAGQCRAWLLAAVD